MPQPMGSLSLHRNFSWTMVGNLVYAGSQWGLLVMLTKLGSPEMIGQFTLALAVTAPVFMLTNLQLRQVQATDAKLQYQFKDYLALRLLCIQLAVVAVTVIALVSGYRSQTLVVVLLMGFAKGLESLSDICYGLFQQHERMDQMARSLMMRGLLALLCFGLGVWLSEGIIGGMIGLMLGWGTILVGYDLTSSARLLASGTFYKDSLQIALKHLKPNWSRAKLWPLARLAFPLGLVMMMFSLTTNLPTYFIMANLGDRAEAELGIFNAIAYLMVAGNIVVCALGESSSPRLAKHYANGERRSYGWLLLNLVGIGFALGFGVWAIAVIEGNSLLSLLYSPTYAQHQDLFVCLMAGSGVQYIASFLGYGITAARYFKIQVPLALTILACLAAACLWLIPTLGLMGAAIALLIAAIVKLLLSAAIVLYAFMIRPIQADAV